MSPAETVRHYHERSKHHLDRYAPGPDGLDWATQPEPFRHFAGCRILDLPLLSGELPARWEEVHQAAGVAPQTPTIETVAHLLELSLGLSAWKTHGGNRWALRCNPSSGNLHPTEAYLICPELPGVPAGIHHYRPDRHCLEQRAAVSFDQSGWRGGVLVALTGIHWREAWKYGLRAFRYCQHDAGHAQAALAYAAALLGWSVRRLADWSDDEVAALCGVDRPEDFPPGEGETPEALLWVGPADDDAPLPTAARVMTALADADWSGRASALSPTHRAWPDIPVVAAATKSPGVSCDRSSGRPPDAPCRRQAGVHAGAGVPVSVSASALIRRRRSAQAFDGVTVMRQAHFFALLAALLPDRGAPPWRRGDTLPAVHPVLFVHRVEGVEPGIYCLPRSPDAMAELRSAMRQEWLWAPVPGAGNLPLYLLAPLDARGFAATVSCHQEIAADSAFMVAMLARFDDLDGAPWRYRERFVEAGMLGQVLYLEAEAGDLQGTGIGCYFDDLMHRTLGLDTARFQDVYQFTVGKALIDPRLGTEPGYAGLARLRQAGIATTLIRPL